MAILKNESEDNTLFSILKTKKSKEGVRKKAASKQPKIKKGLRKTKIKPNGIKSSRHTKGKKPSAIGEIHYVPVVHVVPKEDLRNYRHRKGSMKDRPVTIVDEKANKKVGIAKITSQAPKQYQIKKGYRTKMNHTKMPVESWLETKTISKSYHTGNEFEHGKPPLNKKNNKRVHPIDLKKRELIIKRQKSPKR